MAYFVTNFRKDIDDLLALQRDSYYIMLRKKKTLFRFSLPNPKPLVVTVHGLTGRKL